MASERRLRSDVFLMLGTKVAVLVLNVVTSVIVARALGPEGRGAVAVALSLTMLLVQFGSAGLSTANPYFAAREPEARTRIIGNSLYLAVIVGLLLMASAVAMKAMFPSTVRGLDWTEFALVLVGIPAALAAVYLHSILLGEGRTVAYNLIELVLAVASTVAIAIGLGVFDIGVLGAIIVMVAGAVAGALAYLIALIRTDFTWPSPDLALARSMFKYAARVYVATLLSFLIIRVDVLFVNAYLGTRAVGIYSVAVALCDGLYVIPTVVGVNLFPRVARGLGADSTAAVFRAMAVIYGGICLLTVPFAGIAIRVLYGSQYSGATSLYYWLLPGIFCLGMLTILAQDFAGRGFPLDAMLVWFVGLAANLGINLLFLHHGTYVAALSSTIAYALLLVLHVRLFGKKRGSVRMLIPGVRDTVRFVRVAVGRAA